VNAQQARERAEGFRKRNNANLSDILERIEKASGSGLLCVRLGENNISVQTVATLGQMGYSIRNISSRMGSEFEISW
jgi:hypothetical protein